MAIITGTKNGKRKNNLTSSTEALEVCRSFKLPKQKMKIAGFTIIRNAIKFDYPVVEAITSILPLCDEFMVAVGNSEDETLQLIKNINSPKIKIIETIWDDTLREGGKVLAIETNKAFDAISNDFDWCFYIQSDECVHENDLPIIKEAMLKYKDDVSIDGLLFNYKHFYGSYDFIGSSLDWYGKEIRIIKNNKAIRSYKDAQGFRKIESTTPFDSAQGAGSVANKLSVKLINASIHHYGWVKPPKAQQEKQKQFHKMWHSDEWMKKNVSAANEFDYSIINQLHRFTGTHPQVMQQRINAVNWTFEFDESNIKLSLKKKLKLWVKSLTGWQMGEYKNYRLV